MRWKLFDHAAHLGGALFGLCVTCVVHYCTLRCYNFFFFFRFWSYWGQKEIWGRRVHFLQVWHEFRTGTRPDK